MFARTSAASVLLLAGAAVGSPGCALDGGACICEDAAGQTWDVTELTAPAAGAASQVVAVGTCSGTYCQGGGFQYFVDICGTMNPPTSCYIGMCCSAVDTLNMYRLDMRGDCPPGTGCQCDKLGEGPSSSLQVETYEEATGDDGDTGLTITYQNNAYYNSYGGWTAPVLNIICDPSAASSAYEVSAGVSANPEVVNAPSCTTNFCTVTINWRTPVVCAGGGGWTLVVGIVAAAGVYVAAGLVYGRYVKPKEQAEGDGLLQAHPHFALWLQLPGLVQDGILFCRRNLPAGWPLSIPPEEAGGLRDGEPDSELEEEKGGLVASDTGEGKKKRRNSEAVPRKPKRKSKPRPSLPVLQPAAVGPVKAALLLAETKEEEPGVHPSQAKIKVVLQREPEPEPELDPVAKPKRKKKPKAASADPGGLE